MKIRSYSELKALRTYEERLNYLAVGGHVGLDTFGFERYLNQRFYKSNEWKRVRNEVILRDNGCDLGVEGYPIDRIYIHHMNPIQVEDFEKDISVLLNPEYLISCSLQTHNSIHYGDTTVVNTIPVERSPNDTCPWK